MSISWTFNARVGKNTIYIQTTHCLTKSNSLSTFSSKNPIRVDSSPN